MFYAEKRVTPLQYRVRVARSNPVVPHASRPGTGSPDDEVAVQFGQLPQDLVEAAQLSASRAEMGSGSVPTAEYARP